MRIVDHETEQHIQHALDTTPGRKDSTEEFEVLALIA